MAAILLLIASLSMAMGNPNNFQSTYRKTLKESNVFGVISDLHLHDDPASQCDEYEGKYSNVGCDSDPALVDAAVCSFYSTLSLAAPGGAGFILHLGDNSWHFVRNHLENDTKTIYKLTSTVFDKLTSQSKSIPIVATLGNNDFPIKYHLDMSEFYPTVMKLYRDISDVKGKSEVAEDFEETFLHGGYFSVKIKNPKIRVISLNTLYLTTSVEDSDTQKPYGDKQLDWVESTLAKLDKKEQVIFIGHHPPSISIYYLFKKGIALGQWTTPFLDRFLKIVSKYKSRVVANFFGHVHSNILNFAKDQIVTISSPAVSPIYGGQPSYQLGLLHKKKKVLSDVITFNTVLDYYSRKDESPKFSTYGSLAKLLRVKDLTLPSLLEVQARLLDETSLPLHAALRNRWYQERYTPALPPHLMYCFTVNVKRPDFLECVEKFGYKPSDFDV